MIRFTQKLCSATFLFSAVAINAIAAGKIELPNLVKSETSPSGRMELYAMPKAGTTTQSLLMGYTDQPVSDDAVMPAALSEWLDQVQQATAYAERHPEARLGTEARGAANHTVVAPLLGTIRWNQSAPFNMYCPEDCPVGCVATATAQVMYYYKYPEYGIGEHTYTQGNVTHTVNFGETHYAWDKMYDRYTGSRTQEQNEAVALLSYHVGVSADMSYSKEGSGAYCERAAGALKEYFGYNKAIGHIKRANYSYAEWEQLLDGELQAGRPIIFDGFSDMNGHAFVIDGRNAEGLYHVNWGWGGSYDGYFDICILNPETANIGAELTELGFCMGQGAVINITSDTTLCLDPVCTVINSGIWIDKKSSIRYDLTLQFENQDISDAKGTVGYDIFDEQGQMVKRVKCKNVTLKPLYIWVNYNTSWITTVSSQLKAEDFEDGLYTCKPWWMTPDSVYQYTPAPYYINSSLSVSNHKFDGLVEKFDVFQLEATDLSIDGKELAVGRPYDATAMLTNVGTEPFCGPVKLTSDDDWAEQGNENILAYANDTRNIRLDVGESCTVHFNVMFDEERTVKGRISAFQYNTDYMQYDCLIDGGYECTVAINDESPASLVITRQPELLTDRCEVDGEVTFRLIISHMGGGNFSDPVMMKFFGTKKETEKSKYDLKQDYQIQRGTEADTLLLTQRLTGIKGQTRYYARPYYQYYEGKDHPLQIQNADGSLSDADPIEVKVYNASAIETITVDAPADDCQCFDLMGRRITTGTQRGLQIRQGHLIMQQ